MCTYKNYNYVKLYNNIHIVFIFTRSPFTEGVLTERMVKTQEGVTLAAARLKLIKSRAVLA